MCVCVRACVRVHACVSILLHRVHFCKTRLNLVEPDSTLIRQRAGAAAFGDVQDGPTDGRRRATQGHPLKRAPLV